MLFVFFVSFYSICSLVFFVLDGQEIVATKAASDPRRRVFICDKALGSSDRAVF
jgi:hypothetical protein